MEDAYARLIAHLNAASVDYDILAHEPVFTMDDVARVLDIPEAARVKSIVLEKGPDSNPEPILCGISASGRLSVRAVSSRLGVKRTDLKMASPASAERMLGVPRGAIGLVIPDRNPRVLLSNRLQGQTVLYFGAGRNDRTLRLPVASLMQLCRFEFGDIEQE